MRTATAPTTDTNTIFDQLETPYIVFAADDPTFTVIGENKAHAKVAMVSQSDVIGQPLLDAFPDTSEKFVRTGKSDLLTSIRKVIKTKKPDSMPLLKYDLRDEKGEYTLKYWNVTHHPIFGADHRVTAVCQETKDITDEILLDQKLAETRTQLDQMLETAMIGTWSWNLNTGKIFADTNLARMFGIDFVKAKKGLPLSTFTKAIHSEDRARIEASINEAIQTGNIYEEEYRTVTGDGSAMWVFARGYVSYDDNKQPELFTGVIIDISGRKAIEQELTDSESRLRFLADAMPQLVWIAGKEGKSEFFNKKWFDFLGIDPSAEHDGSWVDYIHQEDRANVMKQWKQSVKTGKPFEMEYRLYHGATSMHRWVIARALPFEGRGGVVSKWYGTCTDIDAQKRSADIQTFLAEASKELSSSLNYQKTLKKVTRLCVPNIADWCSIDLINEQGLFEQVSIAHTNPAKLHEAVEYRRVNPIDPSQETGLPQVVRTGKSEYFPYISDELLEQYIDDPDHLAYMKSFNLHSIIIAPITISGQHRGGITFASTDSGRYYTEADVHMAEELAARISLAISNSKLYTEQQESLMRRKKLEKELRAEKEKLESRVRERTKQLQETNQGLRKEIEKRLAIEDELQDYADNLSRSNAELEDFAYVASHDLQEPLRKIQAFSNLLLSEHQDEMGGSADYIKRMHVAAARMSTLIEDLLAFSRVSTQASQPATVQLNEVVADVLVDLETRLEECSGIIRVGKLPEVIADPTHMRQLFQNLVGNALKFHKEGVCPTVEISSKKVAGMHEIRVKDDGIGFDPKYINKIFSVFQRLHGRDAYEGTGIGLAVCRKIVERYGGTITAESAKNKGATFIVRLPQLSKSKENQA